MQTVLEIREKKLEEKRREMAQVVAILNKQVEARDALSTRHTNAIARLEQIYASGEELDIMEITNFKDFAGRMTSEIRDQEKTIEQTNYLLKFKKLEVSEALKELKILEKLKETQQKKFYQEYEYAQAKEIDDIASTRYKKALA